MKLLLLGGEGQLGWEFLRLPLPEGWTLVALERDRVDLGVAGAAEAAIIEIRPDLVINAMAYTAVDKAESEPDLAFRINAAGPGEMARACAELKIPLIHVSTDYVFDGSKATAYVEDDPVAPMGLYGRTKEQGEAAVRAANPRHLILRTSWVYSEHGANFVKTMLRFGRERPEMRVVNDQRGSPTWAGGLAAAILALANRIDRDPEIPWGTYHYCDAGATSWHGFAEHIFERLAQAEGKRPVLIGISTAEYPTPAKRPANSQLDCGLIERTFGIERRPWAANLDRVLDALLPAGGTR